MPLSLTDDDLDKNWYKYSEQELIDNLDKLSLRCILHTQKVSAEFCVKYFWDTDDKYMKDEDDDIYLHEILIYQKHITEHDLHTCPTYLARLNKAAQTHN